MIPLAASLARMALLGAGLSMIVGCAREDEAAMRARLERWFALGATESFGARLDCAAGMFQLTDDMVKSAMPVTGSVGEMLFVLGRGGVAALDDPDQAPDAALVDLANAERSTGMAMRRAALEARECMDATTEGAFRDAVLDPASILAYDRASGTVVVLDRRRKRLFATMGGQ